MESTNPKHQHQVFISYSHQDKGLVEKLVKSLSRQGLSTWLDTDHLVGGEDWESQITNAIVESKFCLVVLSHNSDPLKPKISKEWSTIQKCLWERQDLLVITIGFKKVKTPSFLNKCEKFLFETYKSDFDALAKRIYLLGSREFHPERQKDKQDEALTNERFIEIVNVLNKEK